MKLIAIAFFCCGIGFVAVAITSLQNAQELYRMNVEMRELRQDEIEVVDALLSLRERVADLEDKQQKLNASTP